MSGYKTNCKWGAIYRAYNREEAATKLREIKAEHNNPAIRYRIKKATEVVSRYGSMQGEERYDIEMCAPGVY